MSVLSSVLEALGATDVTLEAYGRSGDRVREVTSRAFLAQISAHREIFRRRTGDPRRAIALLFKPDETIEFLVTTLAAMAERWTVVPLYPNWTEEQQRTYLKAYELHAVAVGKGFEKRAGAWCGDSDLPIQWSETVCLDVTAPVPAEGEISGLFEGMSKDHPCAWIFTSGTSGELAKLTEITLENIEAAMENIRDVDFVYPGMTLHSPLSASHIFAFAVVLGLLAIKPRRLIFSDVQYLARLPEERIGKVDAVILVPIVLNRMRSGFYEKIGSALDPKTAPAALKKLARIPRPVRRRLKRMVQRAEDAIIDLETGKRIGMRRRAAILTARKLFGGMFKKRLGSPEFVVIGGAKPNLQAMAFLEVMGIRCLQGWGMTETTGPLAVCRLGDRSAFGTCGDLFANCKAYVEDGELIVEGPQIARGYLEPGGNFVPFNGRKSTGDYAEFDATGRLLVLGKASDRITTENGLNYNPLPFEERIIDLDMERGHHLDEAVVIGDGQSRLGCVFFLREGVEKTSEVVADLRSTLRAFSDEKAVDERIDTMEISPVDFKSSGYLGPSGKLIRRRVEADYARIFNPEELAMS